MSQLEGDESKSHVQDVVDLWNSYKNPYQKFKFSSRKERIAYFNLILNPKSQILVLFGPVIVAIITSLVIPDFLVVNGDVNALIAGQFANIFLWTRIFSILFLIQYFTMNFVRIQQDGTLGYWLALGVERNRFFWYSTGHFAVFAAAGVTQALIIISIFTAMQITVLEVFVIFLLQIITNLTIIMLSILITELTQNSELAFFVVIFIYMIMTLILDTDNLVRVIFLPEFYLLELDSLLGLGQILFILIIAYANNKMFNNKNIELGG